MSLVRIENVSKEYLLGEQRVEALRDVTLNVEESVFLAIAGPSGSGKSTLLNLIGCIDTPTRGRILIDGQDVSGKTPDQLADLRARTIGFVFQTFNLLPVLSAEENVEYPLLQFAELTKEERRERVASFLKVVQLSKYARQRPNQLSGGQRQRVAIANLDHRTGDGILALMKEINRTFGTTFIFSTHDKKVMAMADRLVRIEDGKIRLLGVRVEDRWKVVDERRRRRPVAVVPPRTG